MSLRERIEAVRALFRMPRIKDFRSVTDVVLPAGRSRLRLEISGWGFTRLRLVGNGPVSTRWFWGWGSGSKELVVLVPVGTSVETTVRNLFGSDSSTVHFLATERRSPRPVASPTVASRQWAFRHPRRLLSEAGDGLEWAAPRVPRLARLGIRAVISANAVPRFVQAKPASRGPLAALSGLFETVRRQVLERSTSTP